MRACESTRPLLGPYLDGELSRSQNEAVGDHLACCEACSEQLGEMQELGRLLSRAGPTPWPEGLEQRVVTAAASRFAPRSPRLVRRWLPRVAAALIGAATVFGILSRQEQLLEDRTPGRGAVNALFGTLEDRPVAVDPIREFDDELRQLLARPEARIVSSILSEEQQ